MRDRLIKLIDNAYEECKLTKDCKSCSGYGKGSKCINYQIADHLIANGVILPPCKVGDTIWYEIYGDIESAVVYSCQGKLLKDGFKVTDANAKSTDDLEVHFDGKCIGKTVFLTKEEAEKALKEKENDNNT